MIKLHLGSGAAIKQGWENLDLNPGRGGRKHDLTCPLPYEDNSVDFAFTEHFIEHITREHATAFLKNVYKVLKQGGILRVSTPNLKTILDDYNNKNVLRFKEVWNPGSPCRMINGAFYNWDHKFVYDRDELESAIKDAGFKEVYDVKWRESKYPELTNQEIRPHHDELIMEAVK